MFIFFPIDSLSPLMFPQRTVFLGRLYFFFGFPELIRIFAEP